jgi:hypothetical protein
MDARLEAYSLTGTDVKSVMLRAWFWLGFAPG